MALEDVRGRLFPIPPKPTKRDRHNIAVVSSAIPEELWVWLDEQARGEGKTLSAILRRALMLERRRVEARLRFGTPITQLDRDLDDPI